MLGLEIVVAVGAAIILGNLLAPRLRLATPVTLLVLGVLLGLVPQFQSVMIPPELVLLVLLPVLLYWESLTTSLREIRRNLTAIALLSTALVVATAAAVAAVAHLFGLSWGAAWVLGAAVAPTDATAIAALSRMLPRRQVTILRAESLINDGTALVIFGVAVGVTVGEEALTPLGVTGLVLLSYGGGAVIGAVVAGVNIFLRRRVSDPLLGNAVMLLAPFTAFLLAELIEASGVIAVVVSGLIMSQAAPRIVRAQHRSQALAFWPLFTFLINGALFIFVGIELIVIARSLTGAQFASALAVVVAVSVAVIVTRFVFFFGSAGLRVLIARLKRRQPEVDGPGLQTIASLAGFRGAVSLAVALSVPEVVATGGAFSDRDLIVFVTGGVVFVTLVGQALALPFAVRRVRLPAESNAEAEAAVAAATAFEKALDTLPELSRTHRTGEKVEGWVREAYETFLGNARARSGDSGGESAARDRDAYVTLSLAMIAHRRETVIRMRDAQTIDDEVLRVLQAELDREELALLTPPPIE